MAISKEKKEEILAKYNEALDHTNGLVVTEYRGMKMNGFNGIRAALREVGASYIVTKTRLLKIALEDKGFAVPDDLLSGPVAVSFAGDDLPGMVKVLLDKKKDNELLILKGGIIGSQVLAEGDLDTLSKLPTLDELRAQILGMLVQPAQGLLGTLVAPHQGVLGALGAGTRSIIDVLAAYERSGGEAA